MNLSDLLKRRERDRQKLVSEVAKRNEREMVGKQARLSRRWKAKDMKDVVDLLRQVATALGLATDVVSVGDTGASIDEPTVYIQAEVREGGGEFRLAIVSGRYPYYVSEVPLLRRWQKSFGDAICDVLEKKKYIPNEEPEHDTTQYQYP
ncbi:hypothetical protein A2368_00075 [Candidatus Collierbacteria bacterium RIFOXYB1_FULL_49_13]|uniref:Uncharacterized protein n=1 Tax=Candidatus Collierbacteria bacterium RIFOXYB1_FULL_49_13 TaxID=1817728 RepID=A0A1F5FIV5_9BACT|nr:MAG: hypothetical protein A2368_00075 [Candidatus Collierbacteria bacterium RIFOXYB1_FULL_49_13]